MRNHDVFDESLSHQSPCALQQAEKEKALSTGPSLSSTNADASRQSTYIHPHADFLQILARELSRNLFVLLNHMEQCFLLEAEMYVWLVKKNKETNLYQSRGN